ncbi:hypothetical protein ABZ949_02160 [Micromonospora tulbaghiae]|uniref:hypothetical protein n=1 Tax=Micromonospora tulbaghiae TaxID=479978 RepID=UPI0033D5E927
MKLYELRPHRGGRAVRTPNRIVDALDLNKPEAVKDQLTRHLLAVADRDGARRAEVHLYHLDVHAIDGERVSREPSFQFSVPVEA